MNPQALSAADRRVAPRFQMSFAAELASGTVLVPVTVQDLSVMGCGVVIMDGNPDLPAKLGGRGLLHLPAIDAGTFGTVLPIALRNVRFEGRQLIYGLEFAPLLSHQMHKLTGVIDAMRQEK